MQRSLLIGCGHNHAKQVQYAGQAEWAGELTKMDVSPICGADTIFDMDRVAVGRERMPFDDETFDEIGAFNTMEHWGRQGDFRGWFHECAEYWRILKPGGLMFILVPIGTDALADPGHTRFFQANYFGFLSQTFYERNEKLASSFSDYRWLWKLDFDVLYLNEYEGHHLAVVLRKA
jgi:SAM-dependent methyltransferase